MSLTGFIGAITLATLSVLFSYFIWLPLIIKYTKIFETALRLRCKFLIIRHPLLVYLTLIFCAVIMLLEIPFFMISLIMLSQTQLQSRTSQIVMIRNSSQLSFNLIFYTFYIVQSITWFGIFFLILFKSYLLYFNQCLNLAVINQAWQKEINVGVTDWYISNKKRWGSAIWLIKKFSPLYVVFVAGNVVYVTCMFHSMHMQYLCY